METWTLIWLLIFPPTEQETDTTWKYFRSVDLTQTDCFALMVEKDVEFRQHQEDGAITGFELYCKDSRGKPVPIMILE